jgi:hypothetical protein
MKQRSPTSEGLRAMLHRPTFGLAEIAWRWSFGSAVCLLLAFAFVEYLNTLPVSRGDLALLGTGQPKLISQAVAHVFRGSALRAIETVFVVGLALGAAWVIVASLARAVTIEALVAYFRDAEDSVSVLGGKKEWRWSALLALNLFRAVATLVAIAACIAAVLLGAAATSSANPSPGSALLIFLAVTILVWFVWSMLNWLFSLAAIFVVADGHDAFSAIVEAVDFCRTHAGSILAVGTGFGLAHLAIFVIVSTVVAFPLGFAAILPNGVVLGSVLLVALLYFALSDFLYVGRLAAYVAIRELPEALSTLEASTRPLDSSQHSALSIQPGAVVDQSELILSDIPASI